MSAGTPNEEARRRGIEIGSFVVFEDGEGRIEDFDEDGDPVVGLSGYAVAYMAEAVRLKTPSPPDVEPIRIAAFVALYARSDLPITAAQSDRVYAQADEIARGYAAAKSRAESDGVR